MRLRRERSSPYFLTSPTTMNTLLPMLLLQSAVAYASQPNILFLMCDSMDGRVLDPTSPVSKLVQMPNLRKLASQGTNFVNTYAASPQCVPSRTTMFTGRRIDQTQTWSNGQGIATVPSTGGLDHTCVQLYDNATCTEWQTKQNITQTLVDSLRHVNCEACLYGKGKDRFYFSVLRCLCVSVDLRLIFFPPPTLQHSNTNTHTLTTFYTSVPPS